MAILRTNLADLRVTVSDPRHPSLSGQHIWSVTRHSAVQRWGWDAEGEVALEVALTTARDIHTGVIQ